MKLPKISAKSFDMAIGGVLASAFAITAYFIAKPQTAAAAMPIVLVTLAIRVLTLPIAVSVWQKNLEAIIRAKLGKPGSDLSGIPRS